NDDATILSDAKWFWDHYFPRTDDEEGTDIRAAFDAAFAASGPVGYWDLGRRSAALVQMYDLVAPLDANLAGFADDRRVTVLGSRRGHDRRRPGFRPRRRWSARRLPRRRRRASRAARWA